MIQKQIEVIIDADGNISIDAHGFKGADCQKATAFLEKALGTSRAVIKKKEFHEQSRILVRQS